jgi:hypothetical protein
MRSKFPALEMHEVVRRTVPVHNVKSIAIVPTNPDAIRRTSVKIVVRAAQPSPGCASPKDGYVVTSFDSGTVHSSESTGPAMFSAPGDRGAGAFCPLCGGTVETCCRTHSSYYELDEPVIKPLVNKKILQV